jgi:hypothetical protein
MNPCKLVLCFCLLLVGSLTHAGPKIERWQTAAGVQVLLVENHSLPIRRRSGRFRCWRSI